MRILPVRMSVVLLGAFLLPSAFGGQCDKAGALRVRGMLSEFAKSHQEGDHLAVYWTYKIEKDSEEKRLKMVRAYADADACLIGSAREIMFYRKDKLMGVASPISGIRLVK